MKTSKKLLAGAVAASMAFGAMAPAVHAEVEASAAIASSYLWRGIDLGTTNDGTSGSGTPAISGDLVFSQSGFYTGVWVSSGDVNAGTEYDLFVGYGGEAGAFSYDVSIWNYVYPEGNNPEDSFGDLSELIVSFGLGPVSFSWYENIANEGGSEEYRYFTLGGEFGAFSATVGRHSDVGNNMTHVDLGYAYNDNLSFTLSQVVRDEKNAFDDDLKVVVSYSIPLK